MEGGVYVPFFSIRVVPAFRAIDPLPGAEIRSNRGIRERAGNSDFRFNWVQKTAAIEVIRYSTPAL